MVSVGMIIGCGILFVGMTADDAAVDGAALEVVSL